MKIGLLNDIFRVNLEERPSGGENFFYELALHLKSYGFDVTIFAYEEVEGKGFTGVSLGPQLPTPMCRIADMMRSLWKVRARLAEMDIIFSDSEAAMPGVALSKNRNTGYIFDFRNTMFDNLWVKTWYKPIGAGLLTERPIIQNAFNVGEPVPPEAREIDHHRWKAGWYRRLMHQFFPADHVMFLDQSSYADYRRLWPKRKCSYHPNPVNVDRFKPDLMDPNPSDQRVVILFATLLEWHKGLLDVLSVMDGLLSRFNQIEFWMAGKGKLITQVEQFSATRPRVQYLGYLHPTEMPGLMSQVDVVVQPSYYEGFGRTVLEALASGVPVVTTGVGGMDALEDASAAMVIRPGDQAKLSEMLETLVTSPQLRRELGARGREYVQLNHSWNKFLIELLDICSDLQGKTKCQ